MRDLFLIASLFLVACSSNTSTQQRSSNSTLQPVIDKRLRDRVYYTYSYYQERAAREARSSSDTDVAFDKLWQRYNDSVFIRCGVTEKQYSDMLADKINEMVSQKDWSDYRLSEEQYYQLMNQ